MLVREWALHDQGCSHHSFLVTWGRSTFCFGSRGTMSVLRSTSRLLVVYQQHQQRLAWQCAGAALQHGSSLGQASLRHFTSSSPALYNGRSGYPATPYTPIRPPTNWGIRCATRQRPKCDDVMPKVLFQAAMPVSFLGAILRDVGQTSWMKLLQPACWQSHAACAAVQQADALPALLHIVWWHVQTGSCQRRPPMSSSGLASSTKPLARVCTSLYPL